MWKGNHMKNSLAGRCLLDLPCVCAVVLLTLMLTACNRTAAPNDQQIRQQTADATRDVKKGAKELATDTKVAAGNAVNGVNAVAQGVRDGINGGKSGDSGKSSGSSDLVDINSASITRLALLPGVSFTQAQDIVAGRPYPNTRALVRRGLLTQAQYDRIDNKIVAK